MKSKNVTIDIFQYRENYKKMKSYCGGRHLIAALKYDAYGLGVAEISKALQEHCGWFMISSMEEATNIRKNLNNSINIISLESIKSIDKLDLSIEYNIIVTLSSLEELEFIQPHITPLHKVCLYFDTGLTGKGFVMHELDSIYEIVHHKKINVMVIMSHLASAWKSDETESRNQLKCFQSIKSKFGPKVLYSLTNTDGIRLGEDFVCDLPRCGRGLHGLTYYSNEYNVKPAFNIWGSVSQIKTSNINTRIGYGGNIKVPPEHNIGIVDVGFHVINKINFTFSNLVEYNNEKYEVLAIFIGYIVVDFKHAHPKFGEKVNLIFNSRFIP